MFGMTEVAVLLIVVVAVLAAKRLPDLARSAGKATRIFKSETRAMKAESATNQRPGNQAVYFEKKDPAPPTPPASS